MSRPPPWRSAATHCLAAGCLALLAGRVVAQETTPPDTLGLLVGTQSRPSFSILGAGARAAGMGGAFTAVADDASAASFNPAGLALLVKPETSLVIDGRRRSEVHGPFAAPGEAERFGASRSSFSTADPNFASFTMPFEVADRNLSLQLSYQRLIDFDYRAQRALVERDADGDEIARVTQKLEQDGQMATLSLAAAYQWTDRLSLGVTLSRWQGAWTFSSDLREDTPGEPSRRLRLDQDNTWTGWNASFGALLRYRYLNLGATFRTAFDGDFTVDSRLESESGPGFATPGRVEATLHWPSSWTAGVAVKPSEVWFLTADYARYDWDDMLIEGLGEDGGGRLNFFDLLPPQSSTAHSTGTWRFGTEHTFFPRTAVASVRAGYFVEPRPQLLAPGDEESSTQGWSVGGGVRLGQVSVDLAYQHTHTDSRTLELVDPALLGDEAPAPIPEAAVRSEEDRVFLSVLYQFSSRGSLRRFFHFLFVGPLEPAPPDDTPAAPPPKP